MVEKLSKIDEIDEKILRILQENAKEKLINIAKKLNLPVSTIYNRIKKLEEEKIIKKYTIEINYKKLGYDIRALVLIRYDPNSKISQKDLLKNLLRKNFVEKGFIITGEWDLIILCKFRNVKEMSKFILEDLRNTEGIKETCTMVILEEE